MNASQPCVIALFGPTAVGKTELALALAGRLRSEGADPVAVSADAFQLYRGLEVLSGAPTPVQRQELEHLLVGTHDIGEAMSAGRFAEEAHEAIDGALATGRQPIVIGGSGLYMQAALTSLEMRPPVADGSSAPGQGGTAVHERLRSLSPEAAAQIDPGDHYRAGRAVALAEAGDRAEPGGAFWEAPLRHPTLRVALVREREELYARIERRVDEMLALGALGEVLAAQASASPTARGIIGFEELPAGAVDEMKARTRRYAKRQMTWTRRLPESLVIDLSAVGADEAAATVVSALDRKRQ
ncbi:MAG: tRNA (adenosine(37)-N6)-dimethylallyltransferase [Solirubrobacterales bacterium]